MASRGQNRADAASSQDIGELLDDLQRLMDRCKVMYEQYFLGIQKLPPNTLHTELERKFRSLTQRHISNTAMRFRFSTLSQKFGSYNTYWKRTMRQIENGTYLRDIARVGRKAARTGGEIPEEVLAKMPKRMRERILRDRDAVAKRREREIERQVNDKSQVTPPNVHSLEDADLLDDLDLDALFSSMTDELAADSSRSGSPRSEDIAARASAPASGVGSTAAGKGKRTSTGDTDVNQLFAGVFAEESESPLQGVSKPRRPKPAPVTPPPKVPKKPKSPPPGMTVPEAQALYSSYKKARELVGADTSKLSYDKLMGSLHKQAPAILEQHNATGVSFQVVVKGDRVVLKATPKKNGS